MTNDTKALSDIFEGNGPFSSLFMLGYAGWYPGQLEKEINHLKNVKDCEVVHSLMENVNDDEYLTSAFVAVTDFTSTTYFGYPNNYATYGLTVNYQF